MKTIIKNMVLGCFALSLLPAITACSGDELPQPIKKPRTMLTLTTDWTGVDKGEKPNSYVVNINENQYTVENGNNVYELKTNEKLRNQFLYFCREHHHNRQHCKGWSK